MIEITGLFIYPIKSCRGISLHETKLGPRGFLHDREFLVVDNTDTFLTQRNAQELATVRISVEDDALTLQAPDAKIFHLSLGVPDGAAVVRNVTIFDDQVLADDAGDEAAGWFSDVLRRPCRLVRTGASYSRVVPEAKIAPALRDGSEAAVSFTDAFPTLIISEESLADLNTRLPEPIPINRFRPNIVVRGCAPYEENTWTVVEAGGIEFGCARTCLRCVISTTDQETGERTGDEPLKTLATYRRSSDGRGVMFGQYLIHSQAGKLRVGDVLKIDR